MLPLPPELPVRPHDCRLSGAEGALKCPTNGQSSEKNSRTFSQAFTIAMLHFHAGHCVCDIKIQYKSVGDALRMPHVTREYVLVFDSRGWGPQRNEGIASW